jgi:hypothetical protein
MQDGKFDHAQRLFSSIGRLFAIVTGRFHDFRELIPEFFTLPDFLENKDSFNLGLANSDVELPPWATSSSDFVSKHRRALESEHVGQNIARWIDLIFRCKQSGEAAAEADNTFHPFAYSSYMTMKVMSNPDRLQVVKHHAANFGVLPRKLFQSPHPARTAAPVPSRRLKWESLYSAKSEVLVLSRWHSTLFFLTSDSILHERKLRQKVQNDFSFPFNASNRESIAMVRNLIIYTSFSKDCFHIVAVQSGLSHVFGYRQQFSPVTGLVASNSVLVASSQDG